MPQTPPPLTRQDLPLTSSYDRPRDVPSPAPVPPTAGAYTPPPRRPEDDSTGRLPADPWAPGPGESGEEPWKRDRDDWIPTGPAPDPWAPSRARMSGPRPTYDLDRPRDDSWPPLRTRPIRRIPVTALTAAGVVTAIVIGVIVFGLTGHSRQTPRAGSSPSSAPATTRRSSPPRTKATSATPASGPAAIEASSVNAVLKASVATRGQLTGVDLMTCDGLYSAMPTLRTVIGQRETELRAARATNTSALPGGTAFHTALVTAFQDSLGADQAYLTWAQGLTHCTGNPPASADSAKVSAANNAAGTAKSQFLALWAPIARTDGLPTYADGGI